MRFSVKIHASFVAYLICTALLSSVYCCVAVVLSLVIHELGHCIAGMMLKEKIIGLDIRKFDDAMTFRIAVMVLAHMKDIENSK